MKNIYFRMIEVMQGRLAATGIPQDKAISACAGAVEQLCHEYGGQEVYLPRGHPWRNRDEAIRREFNGRNVGEICSRYEVSRATLYRVAKK